ncbi:MutS-related protein [Mycoplasma sp. P36-A1]|uniref:lysine 5,6-aminomutase reactivase ATPase KamC n=1 Tax=Mycoplasma sp. P36-A1 TaxID=3252900 RepID=UPI003C2EF7D3
MKQYLDTKQKNEIGYKYVMDLLNINSIYGQDLLNTLKPYTNEAELEEEFNKIQIVQELLNNNKKVFKETEVLLARFKDIKNIVDNLEIMILDEIEIFEIKKMIYNVKKLVVLFTPIETKLQEFNFFDYTPLFEYLDKDNSKMPFFHLYDEYSEKLKQNRRLLKENKDDESIKEIIKDEELKVKVEISKTIANYQDSLIATIKQISKLDLLIAKAKVANNYNLNKPSFSKNIVLNQAYNPMIKEIVCQNGYNYTCLDIDIEENISLITGSNMSGKSVTLKNILLNTLLFQNGFYPFADQASMPILSYILFVSDELQDVENSLSSFGMEVYVLNQALEIINNNDNGLIILDEFARGTNPVEAKKIVTGLIRYLKNKNVYAVLSTHLDLDPDVKHVHYQVKGLDDCDIICSTSDDIQRVMDYTLVKVDKEKTVPYDAFKVMNFLNMDKELKKYIETEYKKGE